VNLTHQKFISLHPIRSNVAPIHLPDIYQLPQFSSFILILKPEHLIVAEGSQMVRSPFPVL
jgi:hypothetical protein